MSNSQDPKNNLLEHSQAKVRLLHTYLVNYLSVITNDRYTDRIRIYDMFCGRGIYDNDGEGSPIAILRATKNLYFSRLAKKARMPSIDFYFSDEKPEYVKSVTDAITELHLHYSEIGNLSCIPAKYKFKMQELLTEPPRPKAEKSFIFIDPYGYKDIKAAEIKALLKKKAEVLLFLPIQFMYRFESQGTPDALKEFIADLKEFSSWKPTRHAGEFVEQLREELKSYLGNGVYVSTFLIEKDPNTLFCLYFFTTHIRGHEKMLEAKWNLDKDAGQGWSFRKVPGQENLIPGLETLYLENDLFAFFETGAKNNCEVYEFVLGQEFLPKHARKVCQKFIANGRLKIRSISNAPVKAGAFYINYDHYKDNIKKIQFEVI